MTMGESGVKQRRKKGTGSIFPTKEGTFRASIKIKQNGEDKAYTKRFATYTEAEKFLDDIVRNSRGGPALNLPEEPTVRDLLRAWVVDKYNQSELSGRPKLVTVDEYNSQIRDWIIPGLGSLELSKIHRDNITSWLSTLNTAISPHTGKPLSMDRKHKIWGVVKASFAWGLNEGWFQSERNILSGIRGPVQKHHEVLERVMSEEDYQKFTAHIMKKGCDHSPEKQACALRWLLAVKGARRQMEVLGLSWEDCHLNDDQPYIVIRSQLRRKPWKHGCGPAMNSGGGKAVYPCAQKTAVKCPQAVAGGLVLEDGTKNGNQVVLPVSEFMDAFKIHRAKQQEELTKAKEDGTFSILSPAHANLVFTQTNGRPWQPRQDYGIFLKMQEEAGLKLRYRVHDLRHTSLSRLLDSSGNLKLTSQIAGHSQISVTSRYARSSMGSQEDAFRKLREMDERRKGELDRKEKRANSVHW